MLVVANRREDGCMITRGNQVANMAGSIMYEIRGGKIVWPGVLKKITIFSAELFPRCLRGSVENLAASTCFLFSKYSCARVWRQRLILGV